MVLIMEKIHSGQGLTHVMPSIVFRNAEAVKSQSNALFPPEISDSETGLESEKINICLEVNQNRKIP